MDGKDSALPVMDDQGQLLARIRAPWSANRFVVTDLDGRRLCLASARWWGLGPWTVTDADGNRLLSMTTNPVRKPSGHRRGSRRRSRPSGQRLGRGFTIRDADDRCVARTSSEKAEPGAPHPDDVVLVENPDVLGLAELISIARIWRTAKKAAIASSTGASSTLARGT
jgi:hypothetical protein